MKVIILVVSIFFSLSSYAREDFKVTSCLSASGRTVFTMLQNLDSSVPLPHVVVTFSVDGVTQVFNDRDHDLEVWDMDDFTRAELRVFGGQRQILLEADLRGEQLVIQGGYQDPRRGTWLEWNSNNQGNIHLRCRSYFSY